MASMQTGVAVEVRGVSKRFRLHHEKYSSLKEKIIHAGKVPYEDLWALRDVSFAVKEGTTVGILGRNGSGKSTLLKCICGVLQPTSGEVAVRGKLAGLLELGAGFNPTLSGRENVYMNGSMLGLSTQEIERSFDEIVEFSELGNFIDNQVKFYSSGMYVRLGFAVAVNVDPDILVIDEVLAVGDERFQRKCIDRIKQFQKDGRTILFVSHSPDQVRSICDEAVVLADGAMVGSGPPGQAVRIFREHLMAAEGILSLTGEEVPPEKAPPRPIGPAVLPTAIAVDRSTAPDAAVKTDTGAAIVSLTEVFAYFKDQQDRHYLLPWETLIVRVGFYAREEAPDFVISLEVRADDESVLFRTDSEIMGLSYDAPMGPSAVDFHFESLPLFDGAYTVNIGISGPGGVMYDWRDPAAKFEVANPGRMTGVVAMPVRLAVVPREWVKESALPVDEVGA